jgi:nucleoid DNA-binding protein
MQRRRLHAADRIAAFVDDASDNGACARKVEILGLGDLSIEDRDAQKSRGIGDGAQIRREKLCLVLIRLGA